MAKEIFLSSTKDFSFGGGGGNKQSDTKINSTKYSSNKTKMSNMRIKY